MLNSDQQSRLLRWADSLESGAYNQCQGILKSSAKGKENHYCCLGVAAEIINPKIDWSCSHSSDDTYKSMSELGLKTDDLLNTHINNLVGNVIKNELQAPYSQYLNNAVFISLNDIHNWSFVNIAEFIRNIVAKDMAA